MINRPENLTKYASHTLRVHLSKIFLSHRLSPINCDIRLRLCLRFIKHLSEEIAFKLTKNIPSSLQEKLLQLIDAFNSPIAQINAYKMQDFLNLLIEKLYNP